MDLQDLVCEIHLLDEQLQIFEEKYGILSRDFYEAMIAGQLAEFDGEEGYHQDFLRWLGLYKTWLHRQQKYQEILSRQSIVEQLRMASAVA